MARRVHADQPGELQRLDAARATHCAVVRAVLQPPWRRSGGAPPVELSNARLSATDFGVQEHEHGTRSFQFFGEYDQCDLPNLMGLEVIIRRCQVIEYHYEKKRAASAAKGSGNQQGLTRDEASYFSKVHRMAGEAMICPELVEWVGKELGRDVEVQKQMRKAREEAKLFRDGK